MLPAGDCRASLKQGAVGTVVFRARRRIFLGRAVQSPGHRNRAPAPPLPCVKPFSSIDETGRKHLGGTAFPNDKGKCHDGSHDRRAGVLQRRRLSCPRLRRPAHALMDVGDAPDGRSGQAMGRRYSRGSSRGFLAGNIASTNFKTACRFWGSLSFENARNSLRASRSSRFTRPLTQEKYV